MTKLIDLERHLAAHGARQLREGAKHSVWIAEGASRPVTVPRHREIPTGTARAICKQLGVPPMR
jgi:DNA-directed RNA polymerase subunit K/omega